MTDVTGAIVWIGGTLILALLVDATTGLWDPFWASCCKRWRDSRRESARRKFLALPMQEKARRFFLRRMSLQGMALWMGALELPHEERQALMRWLHPL